MKKNLLVAFMLVVAGNTFAKTSADTLVVTTQPQMHCQNCEKKTRRLLLSTTARKPNTTTMLRLSRK